MAAAAAASGDEAGCGPESITADSAVVVFVPGAADSAGPVTAERPAPGGDGGAALYAPVLEAIRFLEQDFPAAGIQCRVIHLSSGDVCASWRPIVNVDVLPTVAFLKNRQLVAQVNGVDVPRVVALYREMAQGTLGAAAAAGAEDRLTAVLKQLTQAAPVVIFMKGAKLQPFCRFSKQAVGILNALGCEFESVDVFEDNSVREGMKKFSDWPTFPQLYVKGEFVGGVSIMQEMMDNGELQKLLQPFCRRD